MMMIMKMMKLNFLENEEDEEDEEKYSQVAKYQTSVCIFQQSYLNFCKNYNNSHFKNDVLLFHI